MMMSAISSNRFGLGARADDRAAADPKRGLIAQFDRFEPKPAAYASAPTRTVVANELADYLETVRGLRANGESKDAAKPEIKEARKMARVAGREAYMSLVGARMNAALISPAPFVERLVHFWANHFAVSADKLTVVGMGGLLEVEAIRPHVLGKFSDMLLAVEQHPAMLLYLDQAQSVGPDSPIGARVAERGKRKIGLNENLAREIMELHTLGVRTGYTQGDVTEFARTMTGWTVAGVTRGPVQRFMGNASPGQFVFVDALHQPGERTIMGRRYAAGGEGQAKSVLLDLAAAPATATHIATKLARHFTGDTPPAPLIERLANAFRTSGGDLPSVYRVLIDAPEVWAAAPKFKSPWDWSVSALRAVGVTSIEGQQAAAMLTQLGQPVWRPGLPAGFDDIDATWAGPDALFRRVETAGRLAARGGLLDARRTAEAVLAGSLTPATATAIARCESPAEGLALMLASPEFMRR